MNTLGSSGNLYAPARSTAVARVSRTRVPSRWPVRPETAAGIPHWVCLECRREAPSSTSADPMRTDPHRRPEHTCLQCGEQAWIDLGQPDVRGQLDAIDHFDRRQSSLSLRRTAFRIGWLALTGFLLVMAVAAWDASHGTVIAVIAPIVMTLMSIGIWSATSSGYAPKRLGRSPRRPALPPA